MFLKQAMRYYRLWIYTSNAVLLVSVLVFLGVATAIISHPYLAIVPTPAPYHPSLIYGYLALFIQAGVVQAIGCIGAFRLSQKLLNTYWILLLLLLLGDILVGIFWIFRFANLTNELQPFLKLNIKKYYNLDEDFTQIWNTLQASSQCCGSQGPIDFYNNTSYTILPISCCHIRPLASTISVHRADSRFNYILHGKVTAKQRIGDSFNKKLLKSVNASCLELDHVPYLRGCSETVGKWYKNAVATLMILGFCVITFVKLCFTGILRLEIQEMIQKIRLIQGEVACHANTELAEALGMVHRERQSDAGVSTRPEDPESIKNTPQHLLRHNHLSGQDGLDSDTNSNCALITDTPVRNSYSSNKKPNGNNNELSQLQELRHIRQTQI